MPLIYLDFEASEDAAGVCTLDAMAHVAPARWHALQGEVQRVLQWAHQQFGAPHADGVWDYDLQGDDGGKPVQLQYDREAHALLPSSISEPVTITLTLSGDEGFAAALRERFDVDG